MITAVVNGKQKQLKEGTTVGELVGELVGDVRGVAVARNAEVLTRSEWAATALAEGDRVEVLRAVQGGC
ncbi:MAG: sulfur carrier protein ThiS [Actinomycetota bacterium]|nr:sulfur carrier protein ThiS [Actinomycetota bacterium]